MMIDGMPPERNPLRLSNLYQALAPAAYTEAGWYSALNPNPVYGLIPPYRAGVSNVAANPYQPGLVTSAVDTLRFIDAYGNRTWDRMTQPKLKALSYTINNVAPEDRTVYLKGVTAADDTLRQFGQIIYRRLCVHACRRRCQSWWCGRLRAYLRMGGCRIHRSGWHLPHHRGGR
jgi:hypothetical protein